MNRDKTTGIIKKTGFWFILLILSLTILVPFWMLIINSLKPDAEASALGLRLPSVWKPGNYVVVFNEGKLLRGFLNSCLISFSSVLLTLLTASLASFVIARRYNRVTNFIYSIFVVGIIAPPAIIPIIKVIQILKLYGSYQGIILFYSGLFLPFSIFLITGFIRTIPREIDEAAVVDGCEPSKMFWGIILPMLKPILATCFVLLFMTLWNDFMYPLYLLNSSSKWTITLSVFNFSSKYTTRWNYVFADLIMVSMPVLIVYFLAQNFIVEGMTAGAIKQ